MTVLIFIIVMLMIGFLAVVVVWFSEPDEIIGFKSEAGNPFDGYYYYFACSSVEEARSMAEKHETWHNCDSEYAKIEKSRLKFNLNHPVCIAHIENGFIDTGMIYKRIMVRN